MALNQGEDKSAISPDSLFQVVVLIWAFDFALWCDIDLILLQAIWKVVPRFRGYQQQVRIGCNPQLQCNQWNTEQDAHEFLRYMLDRLHTELLQLLPGAKPHQTWLDELRPPRTVPNSQVKGFGFCCLKIVCFPHLTPGQATVTDLHLWYPSELGHCSIWWDVTVWCHLPHLPGIFGISWFSTAFSLKVLDWYHLG